MLTSAVAESDDGTKDDFVYFLRHCWHAIFNYQTLKYHKHYMQVHLTWAVSHLLLPRGKTFSENVSDSAKDAGIGIDEYTSWCADPIPCI